MSCAILSIPDSNYRARGGTGENCQSIPHSIEAQQLARCSSNLAEAGRYDGNGPRGGEGDSKAEV